MAEECNNAGMICTCLLRPLSKVLFWKIMYWSPKRSKRFGAQLICPWIYLTGTLTPTPRSFSPYPVALPTTLSRLPTDVYKMENHYVRVYVKWSTFHTHQQASVLIRTVYLMRSKVLRNYLRTQANWIFANTTGRSVFPSCFLDSTKLEDSC
jgi:hypothetical protein